MPDVPGPDESPNPLQSRHADLYAGIHADLDAQARQADERLRAAVVGQPIEEVRERAEAAFADLGMHLSDQQLDDYAECVVAGRPFTFVLG
jgi:hypothetical protein